MAGAWVAAPRLVGALHGRDALEQQRLLVDWLRGARLRRNATRGRRGIAFPSVRASCPDSGARHPWRALRDPPVPAHGCRREGMPASVRKRFEALQLPKTTKYRRRRRHLNAGDRHPTFQRVVRWPGGCVVGAPHGRDALATPRVKPGWRPRGVATPGPPGDAGSRSRCPTHRPSHAKSQKPRGQRPEHRAHGALLQGTGTEFSRGWV